MARHEDPKGGVYMIRCQQTRQSYIGASTDLVRRIYQHRRTLINRSASERFLAAFPSLEAVEFRILEFVPLPAFPTTVNRAADERYRAEMLKAEEQISEREGYWIMTLKPTLNIQKTKPPFSIDDLPYGPPEK
jgi:hypothetical protein